MRGRAKRSSVQQTCNDHTVSYSAPDDLKVIAGISPIVGGTEAEAKEMEREYLEDLLVEAGLAHLSGSLQVDLAGIEGH